MAHEKNPQTPTTYVLVGDDMDAGNPFTAQINTLYHMQSNVKIIHAKDGQTIEEALQAIKPPANIVLASHGFKDKTFHWNATSPVVAYDQLFSALPKQGIDTITLMSCYGGSAEDSSFLRSAPYGSMVNTLSGPASDVASDSALNFVSNSEFTAKPIDLFIESLGSFDPKIYKTEVDATNKRQEAEKLATFQALSLKNRTDFLRKTDLVLDANPQHALPHVIGIAGDTPMQIDLKEEMNALIKGHSSTRNSKTVEPEAWKKAITRMQHDFIPKWQWKPNAETSSIERYPLGKEDKTTLLNEINTMAERIRSGDKTIGKSDDSIRNAEELRVAYALTAAYLNESGQIPQPHKMNPVAEEQSAFNHLLGDLIGAHINVDGIARPDTLAMEKALHLQGTQEQKIEQLNRIKDAVYAAPELSTIRESIQAAMKPSDNAPPPNHRPKQSPTR